MNLRTTASSLSVSSLQRYSDSLGGSFSRLRHTHPRQMGRWIDAIGRKWRELANKWPSFTWTGIFSYSSSRRRTTPRSIASLEPHISVWFYRDNNLVHRLSITNEHSLQTLTGWSHPPFLDLKYFLHCCYEVKNGRQARCRTKQIQK